MSSEILSQNDIDALLGGNAGEKQGGRRPEQSVALYDFRRPHRVSKERLRTLEAMYERLVKSVEGWMMGRVRGQIELSLQGDFNGFYSFLLQLEKLQRITRVTQMNLQKINDRDGEMTAQMTLSIFFEPDTGGSTVAGAQ